MANRRFTLTKEATDLLEQVMVELGLHDNRPEALRIALVKGLTECDELPPLPPGGGGFTVPDGVIAKNDDYLMYKHLIIEKFQQPIDDKEVDSYLHRLIEAGLRIMGEEIEQLSSLDNYLLFLVEKTANSA